VRIAYVVPSYPAFFQTYILNEMVELHRNGQELIIVPLYLLPSSLEQHTAQELCKVPVLPSRLFDLRVVCHALATLLAHPLRSLSTLASAHWAAGLKIYSHAGILAVTPKALATGWRLRRRNIDRMHAHFATHTAACAAIAARIYKIPFSFTAHAHDIYCTSRKTRNGTLLWKLRHAHQVFAVSRFAADLLRDKFPYASERIHIAYVGISTDIFRWANPLPRGDTLYLLCITQLYDKKGIDTLIDACAPLRDDGVRFVLHLFGDGPLHKRLTAQIETLRLTEHVIMRGAIHQREVHKQMALCHIFVMPCRRERTGNMDGIPTVFMEAMATGRPVISCPVSGIPELVRDGETGLLVPPDDPNAVATAIKRLAADDALRYRLGKQARTIVEIQHDQRRNARRLIDIMTGTSRAASVI